MKKRILSILLAMVMCMTLLPTVALAEGANVAEIIGGGKYASLAEAVANATDGAIIKLLANVEENVTIPAGKTLTLNLNGQTINGGTKATSPAITNNGTLTITGNGTIKREDTSAKGYYVIDNQGTLTFGKTFTGTVTNGSGNEGVHAGASLITNGEKQSSAKLNIHNGNFDQPNFNVIKNNGKATVNISGGTISCNQKFAVITYGVLNITGGSVTGPISVVGYSDTDEDSTGVANISGGTINGAITVRQYTGNPATNAPKLAITGGKFGANTTFAIGVGKSDTELTDSGESGTISITGGMFENAANLRETLQKYLSENFDIDPNTGIVYSPAKVEQTVKTAVVVAVGVATAAVVTKVVVDKLHEVKAAKAAAAEAEKAAKLAEMPTVAIGDSGDAVTTLQTELNAQGFNCGEADGLFGQNTLNAVIAFQTAEGLTADGVVGAQTWAALL